MSNEQKSENHDNADQQIRHSLVTTAVNFLLNPSVIDKPYEHKTAFLRKKGLTDAEITMAFEKAKNDPKYDQVLSSNTSNNPLVLPPPIPVYRTPFSFWTRLSRFSSSLIVLGVAIFGAHYVYKNYIEPLIFGDVNRDKSQKLEKQLFEMTNSISQLEKHVSSLEESISSQKMQMDKFLQNEYSEYYPTPLALRELKTDIASVKSLLLNRHQFPALPKITTPSIPEWQLLSNKSDDASEQNGEASEKTHPDEENSATQHNGELSQHLENGFTAKHKDEDRAAESVEVKSLQSEHSEEALENNSPVN